MQGKREWLGHKVKLPQNGILILEGIHALNPMLTNSIQRYKDIDAWNETPVLKEEAFERLQTVMQEAGELENKAPYDVIVNNEFAEKAVTKR